MQVTNFISNMNNQEFSAVRLHSTPIKHVSFFFPSNVIVKSINEQDQPQIHIFGLAIYLC